MYECVCICVCVRENVFNSLYSKLLCLVLGQCIWIQIHGAGQILSLDPVQCGCTNNLASSLRDREQWFGQKGLLTLKFVEVMEFKTSLKEPHPVKAWRFPSSFHYSGFSTFWPDPCIIVIFSSLDTKPLRVVTFALPYKIQQKHVGPALLPQHWSMIVAY